MDEVFKKVLNDKDIFDSLWGRGWGKPIPKLFKEDEWKKLGELFRKGKKEELEKEIDNKINGIDNNKLKKRAEWLKYALYEKPNLLKNLFENLEWYGLVKCNLPNMNDYGRVIERYDISIVEQYFVDNIKRERNNPRGKALEKVLEYVKELYSAGVPSEEIAYFVRKLNSLTKYWEIIES